MRGTARDSQRPARPTTVSDMDNRNEVREFLASRRAKVTPEQAGVPFFGGRRRVPGLRRGETDLAGQLPTRSEEFRARWAARNVHLRRTVTRF